MVRMNSSIRNSILTAAAWVLITLPAAARTKVVEAFLELPSTVLPMLDNNAKATLIDYVEAGSPHPVVYNDARGLTRLDSISPDFIRITVTPVSTFELSVLNEAPGKGPAYLAIYTIGDDADAGDSELFFLTQDYQILPESKYITAPDAQTFVNAKVMPASERDRLQNLIPFPTVIYSYSTATHELTAELTVGKYLSREDYAEVKPYIVTPIHYQWTGKKFKLLKK